MITYQSGDKLIINPYTISTVVGRGQRAARPLRTEGMAPLPLAGLRDRMHARTVERTTFPELSVPVYLEILIKIHLTRITVEGIQIMFPYIRYFTLPPKHLRGVYSKKELVLLDALRAFFR